MRPLRQESPAAQNSIARVECAYLGTLASDPSLVGMYSVKPEHLSKKENAQVLEQMLKGNTDPALILRELGTAFDPILADMIGQACSSAVSKHAAEIIQAYRLRTFAYALTIAQKKVSNGGDPDSVLDDLISAVDNGQESEFKSASDSTYAVYSAMQKRNEGCTDTRAISSGYSTIDAFTGGLERGSLVTIAARPSMGKSALAVGMAVNVSKAHAVCLSSLEMDHSSVAYRLIASLSKMDLKLLRTSTGFSQTAWKKSADAVDRISGLKLWIDDNPNRKASQIAAQARRHHARHGLDLLMIDYIGLLTSDGHKSLPRHLQVAEMTRTFKAIAKQLDCCVVILCQLNRDADGQRPTLAHLRESGSIEQDSDVVLFPYRFNENEVDKAVVIVAKNRNGPTGDAPMKWTASSASFEDPGAHHE